MARFTARTGWDRAEGEFAGLVRAARAGAVAQGRELIDLTVSNPTGCGFEYDAAAILGALGDSRAMVYDADPRGMRVAREAVAGYYKDHGVSVEAGDLLLTTSTSEAYAWLFRLLCDPGDEVLVATPGYPLFDYLAELEDVTLGSYPLFYDFGWWIDFAELERKIGPRTRAVMLVHPNNPTGHWTGRRERARLQEICSRHELALIVDEVFLDYPLGGAGVADSADTRSFGVGEHTVLTFVLSGMSKVAGLPQMKVAWMAVFGPEEDKREALGRLEVIGDTFLSLNAPVQWALGSWLAGRAGVQGQILGRVRGNLGVLRGAGFEVLGGEAGWSAVVRGLSADRVLAEAGVVVHPGSFYGMGEGNRVVVGLLGRPGEFVEGVERMVRVRDRF